MYRDRRETERIETVIDGPKVSVSVSLASQTRDSARIDGEGERLSCGMYHYRGRVAGGCAADLTGDKPLNG